MWSYLANKEILPILGKRVKGIFSKHGKWITLSFMGTRLQQFLDARPGSKLKLAQAMKKGPSFVTKLLDGTLRMTSERAAEISKATDGEITIVDLLYPDGIPAGAKLLPDGQLELPLANGTTKVGDEPAQVGDEPEPAKEEHGE